MVLDSAAQQRAELYPRELEPELPTGNTGHVQEILDQARQVRDLSIDDSSGALGSLAACACLREHEKAIADRSQPVTQLVRERGQELVLVPIALAQGTVRP